MTKPIVAASAMFVLALTGFGIDGVRASAAQPQDGRVSLEDRAAIEDLMYKYSYYIDNRAGEAFASTFTDDGRLEFSGTVVSGHDQLRAFGSRPATDTIRNHFVGSVILFQHSPGKVHARSMVIVTLRDVKGDSISATFENISIYDDDLVKTTRGWRFQLRRAAKNLPLSDDFK